MSRHPLLYGMLSNGVVLCDVTICRMGRCHIALSCHMGRSHIALSCVTSPLINMDGVTRRYLVSRHHSLIETLSHDVIFCQVTTCHLRRCHMALPCVTLPLVIWDAVTWRCLVSRHHLSYGTLSHDVVLSRQNLSYETLLFGVALCHVTTRHMGCSHMALPCVTPPLVILDVLTWRCSASRHDSS